MPVTLKSFAELDPELVAINVAEAQTRVAEDNATLDLRLGPFYGTLVQLHGALAGQQQDLTNQYLRARSLKELNADPELADEDLVADSLSNHGVTRLEGSTATGQITIVVDDDITVTVGSGAVFVSGENLRFVTENVFTAKSDPEHLVLPTDRLLNPTPDGRFAFVIEVVAEAEGPQYQIKKDSLVVPLVEPNGFVNSYATSDFTGGALPETNTELLTKMQEGVAIKSMSGRTTMQAMLRNDPVFARTLRSSIIGYGDAEMLRDGHTIWPMSMGGRADWYVRTSEQIISTRLTKEATLIQKLDDGETVWQFSMTRDEAPGFYEIRNIRLVDVENVSGGFEILTDTRAFDLDDYTDAPDVITAAEATFSRFQTAVIQFIDTSTPSGNVSVGDKQEYTIEVRGLPLLAEIQDEFGSRSTRHHGADLLVRAAVPCFLTLHFSIVKQSGDVDPDVTGLKDALCTEVNNIGFIGRLYAAQLHDVIHGYLTNAMSVTKIDLHGRIRYPDGTIKYVRDRETLVIPSAEAQMVSPRTVQLFLSPEDIVVSIETAIPLDP